MPPQHPNLLQILELERARRDGKLSDEEFEAKLARIKADSSYLSSSAPGTKGWLLMLVALVVVGVAVLALN